MGMHFIQNFLADESGATALEYSFLVALVGGALITAAQALAGSVEDLFATIANAVDGSITGAIGS